MIVIKIPTWTTFNKIPAGTPAAGLAALNAALGAALVEGDTNPVWADLQDLDLGGGPLTRAGTLEGLAEVTPIANTAFIGLSNAQLAVAVGGDVEGMQVFFEFATEAELDAEVPAGWDNRTWIDSTDPENPVEVVHTFRTYQSGAPNDYPKEIDGKWYVPNSNWFAGGKPLPASQWVFSGLTIKTVAEYQALQPQV